VLLEPGALGDGRRRIVEADPSRRQGASDADQRVVGDDLTGESAVDLDG